MSPDGQLRVLFGNHLYAVAQELLGGGRVRDVRVLQEGRVVTGVALDPGQALDAGSTHRIYTQLPRNPRFEDLEAECSCGERLCAHVAAVLMAAVGMTPDSSSGTSRSILGSPASAPHIGRVRQHLYYLFQDRGTAGGENNALQVSIWVAQKLANGSIEAGSLCPFALRISGETDQLPRYVESQDHEILRSLITLRSNGPWPMQGPLGAAVLRQAATTGRAFWQSFQGTALQAGCIRQIRFSWEVLPEGQQRLRCETPASVHVAVSLEPAVYIDASGGVWGEAEMPYPVELLRAYLNRPPVTPEQVEAANEEIARNAGSMGFPKLRAISIRRQPLSSLAGKLVLSAGPSATLYLIYNGLEVDSSALRPGGAARCMSNEPGSDVCYEVARDQQRELQLQTELARYLPNNSRSRDEWLSFLMTGVPALQAQGWAINVASDFPYRVATPDDWYADLSVGPEDSWFDLRLGVVVEGKQVNLLPALISLLQATVRPGDSPHTRVAGHVMVRLDDGRYLPVALERMERIANSLVELHEQGTLSGAHALPLPVSQASRVAQLSAELNVQQVRVADQRLRTLIRELSGFPAIQPIPAPVHFRATLRPYQQEGLGWLQFLRRCGLGGVLADDMGLGKTVQTLAHLALEKGEDRLQGPSLIVAPVSVIGNWQQELHRFAPELTVLTLHGDKRKDLFSSLRQVDVVITGYSLLLPDSEVLLAHEFHFLILDEAQTIKNPRAKVSQIARALRARHRLCLTGTPMENHLGELWSLFDFLDPGLLGAEREFQRRYRTPIEKDSDIQRAQALSRRIAPFILRRTKEAVARDLPSKTQILEPIVLEEPQRDFYDGIRLAMHRRVQEVIREQGLARSQITVLDALLRLRQACCDPRLVRDDAETRALPCAKLDWLRTVLPQLVAEGRRVLLFSQFTSMLRLIELEVRDLSIPYCLLTGETQRRTQEVHRFQSGAAPLFLISLKAGGVGLNLTAADTVIHYDPWWNPAVESQATDRAHRIGQEQPVFVYKLIAEATVEEKMMKLQADKHALAARLYAHGAGAPAQWSAADIETLFAP